MGIEAGGKFWRRGGEGGFGRGLVGIVVMVVDVVVDMVGAVVGFGVGDRRVRRSRL